MSYSKEELQEALRGADSIKEVLIRLNLKVNPGNYRVVRKYYADGGVEFPEEFPRATRTGGGFSKLSDEEYFRDGVQRGGSHIRKRLLDLGWEDACSGCGIPAEWQGRPMTLQVDHIDGDSFNNLLDNLRFLCPNCHSQTETYGRRKDTGKWHNYCPCGERINRVSTNCRTCASKLPRKTKIEWPSHKEVVDLVNSLGSFSATGRTLGVSDNAVRKYLKGKVLDLKKLPLKLISE